MNWEDGRMTQPDVLVVGAGLAGLSAALAARELGASVLVLERAPREERGGNSRFSIGAMRAVYAGVDDIEKLVGDLGEAERARVDFGAHPRQDSRARPSPPTGRAPSPLTRSEKSCRPPASRPRTSTSR
jgi:glycine/D-amino acid oxidase-like deaminating enzyme